MENKGFERRIKRLEKQVSAKAPELPAAIPTELEAMVLLEEQRRQYPERAEQIDRRMNLLEEALSVGDALDLGAENAKTYEDKQKMYQRQAEAEIAWITHRRAHGDKRLLCQMAKEELEEIHKWRQEGYHGYPNLKPLEEEIHPEGDENSTESNKENGKNGETDTKTAKCDTETDSSSNDDRGNSRSWDQPEVILPVDQANGVPGGAGKAKERDQEQGPRNHREEHDPGRRRTRGPVGDGGPQAKAVRVQRHSRARGRASAKSRAK